MISVKEFAAERNKSIQAVYQQIKRKRNAELLKGHIQIINGIQYLDDEAVAILDSSRQESPAVVVIENKDERIAELEAANKELLEKMNNLHEKYEEVVEWKADQARLITKAEQDLKAIDVKIDSAVKEAEDKLKFEMEQKQREAVSKLRTHYEEELEARESRTVLQFWRDKRNKRYYSNKGIENGEQV